MRLSDLLSPIRMWLGCSLARLSDQLLGVESTAHTEDPARSPASRSEIPAAWRRLVAEGAPELLARLESPPELRDTSIRGEYEDAREAAPPYRDAEARHFATHGGPDRSDAPASPIPAVHSQHARTDLGARPEAPLHGSPRAIQPGSRQRDLQHAPTPRVTPHESQHSPASAPKPAQATEFPAHGLGAVERTATSMHTTPMRAERASREALESPGLPRTNGGANGRMEIPDQHVRSCSPERSHLTDFAAPSPTQRVRAPLPVRMEAPPRNASTDPRAAHRHTAEPLPVRGRSEASVLRDTASAVSRAPAGNTPKPLTPQPRTSLGRIERTASASAPQDVARAFDATSVRAPSQRTPDPPTSSSQPKLDEGSFAMRRAPELHANTPSWGLALSRSAAPISPAKIDVELGDFTDSTLPWPSLLDPDSPTTDFTSTDTHAGAEIDPAWTARRERRIAREQFGKPWNE